MLTEGPEKDDTNTSRASSVTMDPRLVAMVQFLARRAAERDFYEQVIEPYRAEAPARGQEESP